MKNRRRLRIYSIVTAALLIISFIYRITIFNDKVLISDVEKRAEGRKIVTIGIKNNYYAGPIKEKVREFNEKSKDIYIDLQVYHEDYSNYIRLLMLTKNKPDIFQFSFYDHLKNGQLYSLEELGIDTNLLDDERIFSYKGTPVGVRIAGNTVKFAWNKDILKASGLDSEKGPQNWQEVIEYSEKIKASFPNVVPFEFPSGNFWDIKVSVGENSLDSKNIYTTFWNYKEGKYDFGSAKDILLVYKNMYKKGLLSKEFSKKDKENVRKDFIEGKTAMVIGTYDDKIDFLTGKPLSFKIGVSSLPKLYNNQSQNYYYVEDINSIVASKNSENKEEVKKVYRWILDNAFDNNTFGILKFKSGKFTELDEYDKTDGFKYEKIDPTGSFSYNYTMVKDVFCEVIEGKIKVDDGITKLNNYAKECMDRVMKEDKNYFENYIDKE